MKILIVKMSSLGDILHTLPFVRILKKNFPSSQIDWIVNEPYVHLIKGNPDVSEVIPFKRKEWLNPVGLFKNLFDIKRLSYYLKGKRYDYVIDLQGLYKSMFVLLIAGGKKNIGFSNPREPVSFLYDEKIEGDYTKHAVLRYLSLLNPFNIQWKEEEIEFFIPVSPEDKEFIEKSINNLGVKDQPFAVFAPFSRWKTKMWEQKRFKALSDRLENKGLPVIFVGDKDEKLEFDPKRSLVGKLSINQLYYLMKRALFVLTCDSGAMHIAAASGTKVFAIFGPTSSERTGPFTKEGKSIIIKRDDIDCAPCFKRDCTKGLKCMDIKEEEIFAIIEKEIAL